jgi:predicted Zn-dependent peptidase
MESERLLHPIIKQEGVDAQNEVVKEEKRQRTRPYSNILDEISKNIFKVHPYKDPNVGYMKDLDAATLEEFLAFNKKYYVPNNATLVVAGDIDFAATKKMIQDYFGPIPRGANVVRSFPTETPITEEFRAKAYDENIQIPAVIAAYRTPSFKTRDSKILDMISSYLSVGKSSVLYKKMVDTNKQALAVQAVNISQQDYGIYALFSLPLGDVTLDQLIAEMDEEIVKIQTDLISEKAFQKLQNQFENNYVNSNASVVGIAGSLASYHVMYGDTNLINSEIEIYRSVTREEIRNVANKYLNNNQRLILEYLPKKK